MSIFAKLRRLLRPPRIRRISVRPAGWFAVSGDGVRDVIAWARYSDDSVAGLVAARRGLRPATGRRFHGYMPAAPHDATDVQLAPPAVAFPVADLVEAIGDAPDPWTPDALGDVFSRLRLAAAADWATVALQGFVSDPTAFLLRHFRLVAEHGRAAELDAAERDFLAGLISSNADLRARPSAARQGDNQ